MNIVIPVGDIRGTEMGRTGGKACALALMTQKGMKVPRGLTITTDAYDTYVTETGLRTRIMMELHRKTEEDLRWEELWDLSLRIRSMFSNTPLPPDLYHTIRTSVETYFPTTAVVVRSSAPGEDTVETSFAGLHESYVNVMGSESVIEHIRLVWASLWSDASLLYRRELGLDESRSSMAVVIQEIVTGEVSGIGFGQNPNNPADCVIESVYGLNQGLVDGTIEPDRWILDRSRGKVVSHTPASRSHALYPAEGGTALKSISPLLQNKPPLTDKTVQKVYELLMDAEGVFGGPQDVEWTIMDNEIYVLQSRPITTLSGHGKDENRGWYLSLKRSFENLKTLKHKIEDELVPALQKETEDLSKVNFSLLSDHEVRDEVDRRRKIFEQWKKIYWEHFIPFAHGMRLFGTVYNDTVHPSDPYEFLSLLSSGSMLSIQRNGILQEMASRARGNTALLDDLKENDYSDSIFCDLLERLIESYGDLLCRSPRCEMEKSGIVKMVIEMASSPEKSQLKNKDLREKEEMFLSHFQGRKREEASDMLEIGRSSYRMRDNDNMYMGRLKARVLEAQDEVSKRSGTAMSEAASVGHFDSLSLKERAPSLSRASENGTGGVRLETRQITGQPAGPGIAKGPARIIQDKLDLMNFKKGEVLVCDAIDPNMTFVVPLASAIIERRGGMLIHGAIIAREYGLPCVTGISKATEVIKTGDAVTVDGYLGIVIIGSYDMWYTG
jgi:pyruvate,water dikinase